MLAAGTRLDAYEVLAPLGAGGMGEVYTARDSRVGRIVAIKVLPAARSRQLEAEGRFEREARALASLSHPRICTLFEFTRHEDGSALLIMEYLEGESLADRLARSRLPLAEALRLAIEIADGLAAAHRVGLVHRDLKPANVMLTRSGAKLLDFGLAKTTAVAGGPSQDAITRDDITRAGLVVGTLRYMSPEQLEGRAVDHRSDIWAFGCVVHEMLTGARAFDGGTPAAIAAAILDRDPAVSPVAAPDRSPTGHAVRSPIERVIDKCLAKDPEARWQSASDLRDELSWIAAGGAVTSMPAPTRSRRPWAAALSAAAITLAAVAVVLLLARPWASMESAMPVRQLEMTVPKLSALESLSLSPDGSQLAFIAPAADGRPAVWLRHLGNAAERMVPSTEAAEPSSPPFWSPDGQLVAFVSGGKLRKAALAGGEVQPIADVHGNVFGGAWRGDGTMLVGTYQVSPTHGVHRISPGGARLEPVVPLGEDALLHASPIWLADGKRFLFLTWAFDERRRDVCVASLDDTAVRCLGVNAHILVGLTDRDLVYSRHGALLAQPFDAQAARVVADPTVLAERLAADRLGRVSASTAGTSVLVYQAAWEELRQLVMVDRQGNRVRTVGESAMQGGFDMSAGGERVAVERPGERGPGIWAIDVSRGTTTVKAGTGAMESPVLSSDGSRLAFLTQRDGRSVIVEQATQGGPESVLFDYRGEGVLHLADRSEDGMRTLIGIAERTRRVAALVTRSGDLTVVAEGALSLSSPRLSPNSRWLAYVAADGGQTQVYVSPIPPTGEKWQVSPAGGDQPRWRRDGRELFYLAPDGSMMAAGVDANATPPVGVPQVLFRTALRADIFSPRYAVTGDGQRFLLSTLRDGDRAVTRTRLQVLLNWSGRLAR